MRRAREVVLQQDHVADREVDFVWKALPANHQQQYLDLARESLDAEKRCAFLKDSFQSAAERLFQPQYEAVVRQLCLDLTYTTEVDMPRLGTVAPDVAHDPAQKKEKIANKERIGVRHTHERPARVCCNVATHKSIQPSNPCAANSS